MSTRLVLGSRGKRVESGMGGSETPMRERLVGLWGWKVVAERT